MTYIFMFKILLLVAGILALILLATYIFNKFILSFYSYHKVLTKDEPFDELLMVLQLIINTRLKEYDESVFEKKRALDNNSYENYFKTICSDIQGSISPELLYKLSFYITEDAIYQVIVSTTNIYLSERA